MSITSNYIPGVCNIGEVEISQRKRFGFIGLAITIVLWIALDLGYANPLWKLVLFFPAFVAATGLIQGYSHFCAGFGLKGVFNFGPALGKTDTVEQAEFRAQDKHRATVIFLQSLFTGLIVAAVAYFF